MGEMSFHFFIEGIFTPLLGIFGVIGNLVTSQNCC
jgi:hypothetical protein